MVGFWRLVVQITVWHVAASMCFYAIYAATPLFRDAFDLTGVTVGWLIAAMTLGYAVFQLPIGMATDTFGERVTLSVGLLGLAGLLIVTPFAPTYSLLLGVLFIMGAMYGTAVPGTNKAIFDNIAAGKQHSAIGIKSIGSPIGSATSAILVTGLVGTVVWYFGFVVITGIALVITAVFFVTYSGTSGAASDPPDFRGLIANRPLLVLLVMGFCIGAAYYTSVGFTVLYVNESLGAAVAVGGVVLALLQLASSTGKIVVGWLADSLPGSPRAAIASILFVQTVCGGILFASVGFVSSPVVAGGLFVLLGLTALGTTGLYYSYISILVGDSEIGSASAAGSLATTSSGLVVPPLFGYFVDVATYGAAWGILGALMFIAAVVVAGIYLAGSAD